MNATLLGELITFAILVWVTMKYIWPPITKAMQNRQKKIADGLAAAEKGQKSLELAEQKVKKQLKAAKGEAANIVDEASMSAAKLVEEGKHKAVEESKRILALAQSDVAKESEKAKHELRGEIADLVIIAARKVLHKNIDKAANQKLIDKVIEEI
jgi:F-type H+-transporting ATPase subunit b